MFTSTIDPVLLQLGPLQIRYYGLVYALGFLWMIYMFKRWSSQGKIKLTDQQSYDLAFWIAVGVVVGSRALNIILWEPVYYLANPLKIFAFWEGGMAYHGGLMGAVLAAYLYCRKHNIPALKVGDLIAPPACIVLGLGRLANFANSEIYGPVTSLPWCVNFKDVVGCRHPYQVYSAIKRFVISGVLYKMSARSQPYKDGYIMWNAIFWMNLGRFFLDFVRDDSEYLYAYLSVGQWTCLAIALVSGYILYTKHKSDILFLKPKMKIKHKE